jgi:hypothetical protein
MQPSAPDVAGAAEATGRGERKVRAMSKGKNRSDCLAPLRMLGMIKSPVCGRPHVSEAVCRREEVCDISRTPRLSGTYHFPPAASRLLA